MSYHGGFQLGGVIDQKHLEKSFKGIEPNYQLLTLLSKKKQVRKINTPNNKTHDLRIRIFLFKKILIFKLNEFSFMRSAVYFSDLFHKLLLERWKPYHRIAWVVLLLHRNHWVKGLTLHSAPFMEKFRKWKKIFVGSSAPSRWMNSVIGD